jgi:phosphoglycerol transferase MdoB-like AlkP superfamily enzyme
MKTVKNTLITSLKFLIFWVIVFDFERLIFTFHNSNSIGKISFSEWLYTFVASLRLDLATGALLSILPLLLYALHQLVNSVITKRLFYTLFFIEIIVCALIHGGEINAYTEWNHKLTTRVFTHLLNPDEVVRTADYSMTIWFLVYALLESFVGYKLMRLIFKDIKPIPLTKKWLNIPIVVFLFSLFSGIFVLIGRGGTQQIPINIDAAYFSKNYISNDLSVNSVYFFAKSFSLYLKSENKVNFPIIDEKTSKKELQDLFTYPLEHSNYVFSEKRPNFVFIVMESWTANAIGCISKNQSATPHFDALSKEGILFSNIYATGGTSEIGNASIFSGYPALPEISITMQPDKHRKIPSLNQELKKWNYSSHYLFSGDLKYGNIGGFFTDHGFDTVEDEADFPKNLPHGKLNYYDSDLYNLFLKKINATKGPFMQCAFTGSTHSPYDYPKSGKEKWTGSEADFMNSMVYADQCLYNFIKACKKQAWYKNTVFVLVADHGHASPSLENPNLGGYYHIPLLFFGEPIKQEMRGKVIPTLGSQADIVRTLLYQLGGDYQKFEWAKDLLNPACPEFALHTINRGYGWITPKGNFSYHMDAKNYPDLTFSKAQLKQEEKRCHSFMSLIYTAYKKL